MTDNEFTLEPELQELHGRFTRLNQILSKQVDLSFQRRLPVSELYGDRWSRAKEYGFGAGTNVYDSCYIYGDVVVGEGCWIGMFTVLDGSGKLTIGKGCTIAAGVQIYTHDNLKATLLPEACQIERKETQIGNNCYIGPLSIIAAGASIGDYCVVAANSLVKDSFPSYSIIAGSPAKRIGAVKIGEKDVLFNYNLKE